MTTALLDLAELSARCGIPVARLQGFADAGLLPTARDGDHLGYPPGEASIARTLAGADDLGFDADMLGALATGWRNSDYTTTRQHLADAVTARLEQVEADIAEHNRQAVGPDPAPQPGRPRSAAAPGCPRTRPGCSP
ncbi:hypothetical protein [Actinoplanes subtropicus]|uniref:hypothetical protein n=1 Tax=Actinoplanes subtropicus TaxID=543632 RepID=UPI0004C2DB64|nr:hypothetical protein [Actinoplanes subtropicus]